MDNDTATRNDTLTTGRGFHGAAAAALEEPPATQVAWKEPPRWLPPTLHSLAYRNFFLLLMGQITNSLAMWMDMVARPILVLLVTDSAVQVGLIVAARGVPMMFLQPIAGVVADRFDRRVVMLLAKGSTLVLNFAFALLILSGYLELWHIYATAIIKSLISAFDSPARYALLPSLVPQRLLVNAVGLNGGSMQLVRTISGAVAGFSIALFAILGSTLGIGGEYFGVGCTYLLASIFYVMAVALTYMIKVPMAGKVERSRETWVGSLVTGFKFAARSEPILGILILLAIRSVFGMPYLHVFVPLLAIKVMDFGFLSAFGVSATERQNEIGLGLLMTVSGTGGLIGTLFIATVGERLNRKGLWVLVGQAAFGVALLGLGLGTLLPTVVVAFGFVWAVGVGQAVVVALKNAVLLEHSPNEMRGRVLGLQGLDRGFSTLGGMFSGFAAAALGAPLATALFGGLCVLGTLAIIGLLPGLRRAN